jgi:hypothetical protein
MLYSSSHNRIFHNSLINNTLQVQDASSYDPGVPQSINVWDDGFPSGGNFWSDYVGADLYRGQYQNETGSDGIGDTPYVIDAYNRDHYPIVIYDIALLGVGSSKTLVGQGYSVNVDVKVANQGNLAKNFNITVYANMTPIASRTIVVLEGSSSATLAFIWYTTDFAKGDYTLKAVADTLPGEDNTGDNTFVDGMIHVVIPGDVDDNHLVNMLDLYYVAQRFGATRNNPNYVANYDIDDNCIINMLDLYVAATHFGQSDP